MRIKESRPIDKLDVDNLFDHGGTACCRQSCYLHVHCVLTTSGIGAEVAPACEDTHHFFVPFEHLTLGQGEVTVHSVVKTKADNAIVFNVKLVSTDFVALFVEVDVLTVLEYWSLNLFLMPASAMRTLSFLPADPQEAEKLSVATLSHLIAVNWLQKSLDRSIADVAVM